MSKTLTLEQIRDGLKDRRLAVVAQESGVSYQTLLNIMDPERDNFMLDTLQRVSDYLRRNRVK